MTAPASTAAAPERGERIERTARVIRELDHARKSASHREIVIPPCPQLLQQLRQALACAEPDLQSVARIAGRDVAMAATLVRNANSARFAAGQPVTTVGQAMTRLGLDASAAIMTGFLARHALPVRHPQLQGFWERAALRSQALALVAGRLAGFSPELAYSFGLFSDVGMPVLAQCVRGYGGTLVEAAARIDRGLVATENANHRTDHCVVGAMVARAWEFAPPVVCAIRLHHDFTGVDDSRLDPEVQTLVAAGLLAEHLVRRHQGHRAEAEWLSHGAGCLHWLGLHDDELDDLLAQWADQALEI
ncbi:MAG: HDOD domain-containing protein [Rubrivivax sp.]|nr:HDOD domain-containing protein [Rubrivivax sp.]